MIAGHLPQVSRGHIHAWTALTAQHLGLALAWLTLAVSSIVFFEPAPFDALMIGLILMLPLLRLTSYGSGMLLFLIVWLVIGAAGLAASTRSGAMDVSTKHVLITVYLSFSAVVIAAFVRKNPVRHTRIVVSGLMFASLLAVLTGVLGYFDAVPGAHDLFTKFGRARGTFKDPNVFGPFIVPALIYYVHGIASAQTARVLTKAFLACLVCLGLLISFSRGAWLNAAVALLVYGYVVFIAAQTNRFRLKLTVFAVLGIGAAIIGLAAATQIDAIANLINERAALMLSYDVGSQGRFGGQLKAFEIVAANPLGIGALEFGRAYHGEDVHNVYLSIFLNAGWLGGFLYLGLVATTLIVAFRHALRRTPTQGVMIVMLAAFAGVAVEGIVVDTDHWRHFYILMGVLWGLSLAWHCNPAPGPELAMSTDQPMRNGRSGRI